MAIALNPKIVILDEPTTALDVVTQRQILNLLKKLQKQLRVSFIFITHDLSILGELSDRIVVMYAGKIAEIGTTQRIFSHPSHPYTQALLSSMLPVFGPMVNAKPISGLPPNPAVPAFRLPLSPKMSIHFREMHPRRAKTPPCQRRRQSLLPPFGETTGLTMHSEQRHHDRHCRSQRGFSH